MKTLSMKIWTFIALVFLMFSCASLKNLSFYEDTDSYVNAKKEREQKMEMLAKQRKEQEARQQFIKDSIAQEQEKLNNNPYYREPNYSKDDYYDYEYAARIKRFYNPVSGLSYYDNWYTNYGFYGYPNYGSSIYMGYGNFSPYLGYGYSWGNPYYSYGLGTTWGYPYSYGNNWGYSPWYGYSPYYGGYYPYSYGYSPYYGYNPYYYNSMDINSMTYAPRVSHEGFNSRRTTNNIVNPENNTVKQSVLISPQMNIPKFDESARPKPITKFEPSQINVINAPLIHQVNTNPAVQSNLIPRNVVNTNITPVHTNSGNNNVNVFPKDNNYSPGRPNTNSDKPKPIQVNPQENNPVQNIPTQRNWGGGNNSGGGFSAPKGNGGVGRPR